jgi:HNH endonuclease
LRYAHISRTTKIDQTTTRKQNTAGWKLAYGKIPTGLCVLHKCDVRACVNPEHLFLGTQNDNVQDCKNKGRIARGAEHHQAKFSETDVLSIRSDQRMLCTIAQEYSVSIESISAIKRRKTWNHIE